MLPRSCFNWTHSRCHWKHQSFDIKTMSKLVWCRKTGSVVCQHAKRSTYQARYFWDNSLVSSPPYPCASESGWVKVANDNYVSAFVDDNSRGTIELSGAFQMCFERSCAWRYNKLCVKVYLLCTALCNCGLCNRKWTTECRMQMNREIWVSLALFTLFL